MITHKPRRFQQLKRSWKVYNSELQHLWYKETTTFSSPRSSLIFIRILPAKSNNGGTAFPMIERESLGKYYVTLDLQTA